MGFIVKNTTIKNPLDLICPHTCIGCGAVGEVLCECCKNNILAEHLNYCPVCKRLTPDGDCKHCALPPCFMVGWRDELVFELVEEFKYHSVRALGDVLAELLDNVLPEIDGKVAIVPLPTIKKHVRERGFDHMQKIAEKLAKRRGWKVEKLFRRAKNTVQVGANRDVRLVQAAKAYELVGQVQPDVTYLILDDVWTTGASMKAVTKKLQRAGALKVLLAILAVNRGNLR